MWRDQGYVKTSYAFFDTSDDPDYQRDHGTVQGDVAWPGLWKLIEEQENLSHEVKMSDLPADQGKVTHLAVMIHPRCNEGMFKAENEVVVFNCAAYMAVDPEFDFTESQPYCFYCGEDTLGDPCKTCGQGLCTDCTTTVGCVCTHATDEEAVIDSFVPKPGQAKTTTFSKAQRKAVKKGFDTVEKQDKAMWHTLTGKPNKLSPLKKCLLAVTLMSNMFVNAIGQSTTFIDTGWHGTKCDDNMITSLNKTVEDQDPSLIYIHVPFQDDESNSTGYNLLKTFADEQMKAGKTCIVADSRYTERWDNITPTPCRGDLALHCNDEGICKELMEWAVSRDNGNPRNTDDLAETQFADVLAGLAESHQMDKVVDAAFAGTEEAEAENGSAIDGVFGPEDMP